MCKDRAKSLFFKIFCSVVLFYWARFLPLTYIVSFTYFINWRRLNQLIRWIIKTVIHMCEVVWMVAYFDVRNFQLPAVDLFYNGRTYCVKVFLILEGRWRWKSFQEPFGSWAWVSSSINMSWSPYSDANKMLAKRTLWYSMLK